MCKGPAGDYRKLKHLILIDDVDRLLLKNDEI